MFAFRLLPPLATGFAVLALAGAAEASDAFAALHGDPVHGKTLYQACSGCHSLDENDVGPKHRGVVGRHAAIVPGYNYSPALKASGLTWTKANLDRWLTNPQGLVPGARMFFSVKDPQSRADIIAYLSEQR
ncbi:c-type cytochrome [Phenylobacterium montanum]|uniref:C-type cytochrome n=1 Tax=Phenylobacterium montanum TaxID=2823693 RepID=A0A975FXP3_9CAUL|nr:c-type cytochrome [Caulobacter sp. S6]QUD87066.1 c-type cytochrome [Caulobacter sp. S6]